MTDSNLPPESAETAATREAAAQKAADRHTATRKVYDDISSPYDKLSLNAKERKAYERKVLNIGLVLIMIVVAGIGIAAHKLISGIDNVFSGAAVEFKIPETPFSPPPAPPPPAQPTRMNLPDRTVPTADPALRRVTGRVTGISGGIDLAKGTFDEPILSIRFLIAETGQICSIKAVLPPHIPEPSQNDAVEVTYAAEAASEDICATAVVVFAPE